GPNHNAPARLLLTGRRDGLEVGLALVELGDEEQFDAAVTGAAAGGLVSGHRAVLRVTRGREALGGNAGLLREESDDVHGARDRELPVGGELGDQTLGDGAVVGVARDLDGAAFG